MWSYASLYCANSFGTPVLLTSMNDFIAASMKLKLKQLNFDPHRFCDYWHAAMVMLVDYKLFTTSTGPIIDCWVIYCIVFLQQQFLWVHAHAQTQKCRHRSSINYKAWVATSLTQCLNLSNSTGLITMGTKFHNALQPKSWGHVHYGAHVTFMLTL